MTTSFTQLSVLGAAASVASEAPGPLEQALTALAVVLVGVACDFIRRWWDKRREKSSGGDK